MLPIKGFANGLFCRLSSSAVDHAERSCPSAESVAGHLDQSRYDGHFESIWYHPHPLLRLNREGECLAARLRPGNVHSADGWEELLLPEIERHQTLNKEVRDQSWDFKPRGGALLQHARAAETMD